ITEPGSLRRPLQLCNLLHDFEQLRKLLLDELDVGCRLDAFLLAAGMSQILEDHLHRDLWSLAKGRPHLRRLPGPARALGGMAGHARTVGIGTRSRLPGERRLVGQAGRLWDLVEDLAAQVLDDPDGVVMGLPWWWHLLEALGRVPPELAQSVVRLPTCFRSLDQRPKDCVTLMERFTQRWPDPRRAVLVVGLRTSGSYLAPLHAAALRRSGWRQASAISMRPGQDLLTWERGALSEAARAGALIVLADDPPSTGASLATTIEALEALGAAPSSMVLALPLLGD